jgi:hypothetical protein
MQNLRIIALIGLITFSLLAAVNNGIDARQRWTQAQSRQDPVSRWETRLQPVLKRLPEHVSVLGYVADWDLPGAEYNLVDQETEYTLTQYALAPRAVQPGLEQEWIIGNFTQPDFRDWLDGKLPSYEVTEMGFGLYLIHRTSP